MPRPRGRVGSAQNGEERFVDAPHVFGGRVPDTLPTRHVDRPDLFDENSGSLLGDDHLRVGTAGLALRRSGGDENDRPRQRRVRLHDHSEPTTVLLVSDALRHLEFEDLSPRCTHELHERRHLGHLLTIVGVRLQGFDLGHEAPVSTRETVGGVDERTTDELRSDSFRPPRATAAPVVTRRRESRTEIAWATGEVYRETHYNLVRSRCRVHPRSGVVQLFGFGRAPAP